MIFDLRRRAHFRRKDVTRVLAEIAFALAQIEWPIFVGITAIAEQNRHSSGALRHFIFMHGAGRDKDTRRRVDLVHLSFEEDLSFQTAEVGVVADEIIKLVGVVAVRHLIIRHRRRQILRFMYRDVDIRLGVRIAIDKDMPFDRQPAQLAQRPFLFVLAAKNSGSRLDDIFC